MSNYAEVNDKNVVVQIFQTTNLSLIENLKKLKPNFLFIETEFFGDAYLYKYVDGSIIFDPNGKPTPNNVS